MDQSSSSTSTLLEKIRDAVQQNPSPDRLDLHITTATSGGIKVYRGGGRCSVIAHRDNEFHDVFEHPGFKSVHMRLTLTDDGNHSQLWLRLEKLCPVLATYPFQTFEWETSYLTTDEETGLYRPASIDERPFTEFESSQFPGRILHALSSNGSLEHLTLKTGIICGKFVEVDDEAEAYAAVNGSSALRKLFCHSTLSTLSIDNWPLNPCEYALLASALANNSLPLEFLSINYLYMSIRHGGFRALMASFATNTSLRRFSLYSDSIQFGRIRAGPEAGPVDVASTTLASSLSNNTTLQALTLNDPLLYCTSAQVMRIMKALEKNTTLTSIKFYSRAIGGEKMYEAIIDLLSVNVTLETLDVTGTPLAQNPAWMSTINDMLRSSKENKGLLRAALDNFPRVQPTATRVFFCGQGFAGKSTLQRTMVSLLDHTFRKKLMQLCDSVGIHKQLDRTMGIEVTSVDHDDLEIFFWDLAGQREYHAFHDIMFPNEQGPSLFLIVCSLTHNTSHQQGLKSGICKTSEEILGELKYWLCYIASSTKKISRRTPHVSFVFTHEDMVAGLERYTILKHQGEAIAEELKQDFDSVAKVVGTFFVDSHKAKSVRTVAQHALEECKKIVNNCQPIFSACNTAKMMLANWMKDHPYEPWMEENDFIRLCRRKLPKFEVIQRHAIGDCIKAILISLHQTGTLIYFQNLGIVLVNLQWFCKDFMGGILRTTTQITKESGSGDHKGVWKRGEIKVILQRLYNARKASRRREPIQPRQASTSITLEGPLDVEHLVKIMLQLELCFEMDSGNDLFIPATLCQSELQMHRRWTSGVGRQATEFGYVGRRIKCDDENHTFLTPGFFPRLQVHLKALFPGLPYELEKDLIKIVDDRLEVLIEFNEAPASFIDIMVRFLRSKDLDCVLEFISNTIIQRIRDLQRSTRCWQGVYLVEVALRPSCVETLVLPEIKMNQCVSLEVLSNRVLDTDQVHDIGNISYTWSSLSAANQGQEYTPIIELLGEKRFRNLVAERFEQVEELSIQLGIHDNGASSSRKNVGITDPSFRRVKRAHSLLTERDAVMYDLTSRVQRMDLKIDAISTDIKVMKDMLLEQKERLMPKLEKLHEEFRNRISAGNTQVPQFFILSKQESSLATLAPCLSKFKLHFMCESQPMPHLPFRQEGIEVMTLDEGVVKSILPYLQSFLSMLSLGFKLGAPLAQAHGLMIPDLSSLIDSLISASRGVVERSKVPQDADNENASPIHSGNIGFDPVVIRKARIWVHEFLQEKGCDKESKIHEKFGLLKKQIRDGQCAWLCDDHYRQAL